MQPSISLIWRKGNAMSTATDPNEQIKRAQKLLITMRHAAYATINEDGTPHNSPLALIYNDDLTKLYIGSYSASVHAQNLMRTGRAFAVAFDSQAKGQGGIYITGDHAHDCEGDELVEALRVHNAVRTRHGSDPIDISYYRSTKPSQRMYVIDITKIEVQSVIRHETSGLIVREGRVPVDAKELLQTSSQ